MKKFLISLLIVIVVLSTSCIFFGCDDEKKYYEVDTSADNLVSISDGTVGQTMNGFGASSAWWSQIVGDKSYSTEAAKLLYSKDGLAMNIYRYNVGAGSVDVHTYGEHDRMTDSFLNVDPSFDYANATTQELLDYVSDINNYDFTKDAVAQTMLEKCYSYGCINEIVLFANSPHYILTKNNQAHCDSNKTENISSENYEAYAQYLMKVLKYFVVDKGYPVKYLSPINEPQWDWNINDNWNKQEGCYYSAASCAACLDVVYEALKTFNTTYNTKVKLDGFESGNWVTSDNNSNVLGYLDAMKEYDYFDELDHVSFHSYSNPYNASKRKTFMERTKDYGIQVSMSEYCQMDAGYDSTFTAAKLLSVVMSYDISILKSCDWTWWIAMSNRSTYNYNDGLIYINWWDDNATVDDIDISPRYYAMKHYSGFVKSGDKYVDVKISNKTSNSYIFTEATSTTVIKEDLYNVFKRADGTVVIVYSNVSNKDCTWAFADQYGSFEAYTSTDSGYLAKTKGDFKGTYKFAKNSITTLILK